MNNIEIFDNFLDDNSYLNLRNYICNGNFPWYYNDCKVKKNDNFYQLNHLVYIDYNIFSPEFHSLLHEVYKKLKCKSLIRVKANLTLKEKEIFKYDFHTDYKFDCKTSIFYLNSNDGKTIFKTGEEINSVQNRMVTFPTLLSHTGTSHTNTKERIVINFNYF